MASMAKRERFVHLGLDVHRDTIVVNHPGSGGDQFCIRTVTR
jgi:hypothetical protein